MHEGENSIAVIYLSYTPFGIDDFAAFLDSYMHNNAGCSHNLVLLFKGYADKKAVQPFLELAGAANLQYSTLYYPSDDGFDIDAYYWAASQITDQYCFFLNSRSIILHDQWLLKYYRHITNNPCVISATGSALSYYSAVFQKNSFGWEGSKGFLANFRKYKLFIKTFFYWRFLFRPFPNAHIRTNAFMIQRSLLLQTRHQKITSKFEAYRFESGRSGFTSQLTSMGYKVLVIDRNGVIYEPGEWRSSKTFWAGEQENLLIADNQTMIYEHASPEEKKTMTWLAWGDK